MTVAQSPASLFMELWRTAKSYSPSVLSKVVLPGEDFNNKALQALEIDDATASYEQLIALRDEPGTPLRGRVLALMFLIDKFFLRVHPRSVVLPRSLVKQPPLPEWLVSIKRRRLITGYYDLSDNFALIPRGPLTRVARDECAASAECLPDYFAALSVVPTSTAVNDYPVAIRFMVVGSSVDSGVPPSINSGAERMIFIPLASQLSDVQMSFRQTSRRRVVRFSAAASLDVTAGVVGSLKGGGFSDIAIAPELLISEAAADDVSRAVSKLEAAPRLFVCGSGNTNAQEEDQAWNESRVLNGVGAELWRQRKIWPAFIDPVRAAKYQMPNPNSEAIYEDNCSGSEILVVDVDTLGRCVVLICQDIMATPLAEDINRCVQPDWIFSPLLDEGVGLGRWAHQRAFALSPHSNARFVMVSSTALGDNSSNSCGLAVGPRAKVGDDDGRVCGLARVEAGGTYAVLTWREDWSKTILGSD